MRAKLIAMATDRNKPGLHQLERSLKHFGWDYEIIGGRYVAYGSKQIAAYEYAKKSDCTHLFIVDAYDVFVLGTMTDALNRIPDKDIVLFNAESQVWPYSEWKSEYPITGSKWNYLNGGAAFVAVDRFCRLFEENPISHTDNDQVNLARIFLDKRDRYNMKLDTNCDVFQSIAFEDPDDFYYDHSDKKLTNLKTSTQPIVIHGNGGTDMSMVYNLL